MTDCEASCIIVAGICLLLLLFLLTTALSHHDNQIAKLEHQVWQPDALNEIEVD